MKCLNCNSEMIYSEGEHHYTECGLDNVYLEGVGVCNCSCGEQFVSIPAMPELHSLIGEFILKKKSLLNGKEVRFLRKNIGLTATKLSKIIGVDNATISRWENNSQAIDKSHDRLIRLVYSNFKNIPTSEIKHLIEEDFEKIEPRQQDHDVPPYKINWDKYKSDCSVNTWVNKK